MKLNPEKFTFGMASDQSYRENNKYTHEQKRSAEINRKDSSLVEVYIKIVRESFKFISVLKKQNKFEWTDECQQDLKDLKSYLSNLPLLAKPKVGERLLIYLTVSEVAVSAVLVREDKGAVLGIVPIPPSWEVIRLGTGARTWYRADVIKSDSQLVVNQMQGTYVAREMRMQQYLEKIPREENAEVDALANLAFVTDVTNAENAIVIHLFHSALDQDKSEITSAPYHPTANGQDESTNKFIINTLKKRLEESKGKWPKVLPGVLRAYRATAKSSTGETPFSLVCGAEALIPVEIGEPSTRYTHATEEANEEEMRVNLDLLLERRKVTLIRLAAQKQMIEQYYNRIANFRYFKIGDFILKKVFRSTKTANAGKLSPNWEGPYRVRGIAGKGSYEFETSDGKILPSNRNVVHLKKYYF
ncbi:PREDICTED: uncharacterized protein LOC109230106 [Nicotiana attenuata]|uniref:uncharacterized protein LOC109230106 n=1 Tax=Nicotiana attenuata TaxID=49451 RepID=UPI00090510F9|nr:PREDICTED: uncharacterized protein LOC109230106 [Nicotiana attenuata]